MIPRTALEQIEYGIRFKPVTLVTGARQTGKTTLCLEVAKRHGFSYVTLADRSERAMAVSDPDMFLRLHPAPLVIDEAQYAPGLFESMESEVDRRKRETGSNEGMYIVTGSQVYGMMAGVSESMSGRVTIVDMSPLSMSEILGREERPFRVDFESNIKRSLERVLTMDEVYGMILRGGYPELYEKPDMKVSRFYSDYVDTYLEKDVKQMVNVKDTDVFARFLAYMASLTGQELVYEHAANDVGIDVKTLKSWISVLVAGGIIRLLEPFSPGSNVKSLKSRRKVYFRDTGLACYLARVFDAETLRAGYLGGHMMETFVINEIIKSYTNNCEVRGFYYYRESDRVEVDLVMVGDGVVNLVEVKSGMTYDSGDVRGFRLMKRGSYGLGPSCIICMTERPYPIGDRVYALPISSI